MASLLPVMNCIETTAEPWWCQFILILYASIWLHLWWICQISTGLSPESPQNVVSHQHDSEKMTLVFFSFHIHPTCTSLPYTSYWRPHNLVIEIFPTSLWFLTNLFFLTCCHIWYLGQTVPWKMIVLELFDSKRDTKRKSDGYNSKR